jgi:hypothetical protein
MRASNWSASPLATRGTILEGITSSRSAAPTTRAMIGTFIACSGS